MVFPVLMYGCESWTIKKAVCWRIDAFELWYWISLDSKEIKLVNAKRNQSWILIGRTDAETEAPIIWLPDAENWCTGKDPDAGKDSRQEENETTEDEMVGWHHWLDGHEFEQAPGVGDGQGSLACCSLWGCKESDMTEWLNWIELSWFIGRTDAEAEAPKLWLPDAKSQHIGKDSDAGKDWGQEEKGMTEDEVVGWHHWLNRHEFEKTPGDCEGQGSLACCNPQGHKESDITERLNNNNTAQFLSYQVSMATCVTRKLAQGQIYP